MTFDSVDLTHRLYDLTAPGLAPLAHTDPTSDGALLLGSGGNALFSIPLDCH